MGLFSILNWDLPISVSGFQDASQSSSPGPEEIKWDILCFWFSKKHQWYKEGKILCYTGKT